MEKNSYFRKDLYKKWCITDAGDKVSLKLAIVAINVSTFSNWRYFQKKIAMLVPTDRAKCHVHPLHLNM